MSVSSSSILNMLQIIVSYDGITYTVNNLAANDKVSYNFKPNIYY